MVNLISENKETGEIVIGVISSSFSPSLASQNFQSSISDDGKSKMFDNNEVRMPNNTIGITCAQEDLRQDAPLRHGDHI